MNSMHIKAAVITEDLRETLNTYLGVEFIPESALGLDLYPVNDELHCVTFQTPSLSGKRILSREGSITNVITEIV
jgi:hypothetical protein